MKLITTASYYGSGSSAITDLLSEYDNVKSLGSGFECRIAHDMFGISDLEYYLVENYHRHNSSTAINKFLRLMDIYGLNNVIRLENYPSVFGEEFKQSVDEYIKDLTVSIYNGGSHIDIYEKSDFQIALLKFRNRLYKKVNKPQYGILDTSWEHKKMAPLEKARYDVKSYISFPKENFISYTKKFTSNLFKKFNDNDYLMVDQLIPVTNTMRYTRYFDEVKVICVDRDPRDIYYCEKNFWKGGVVPTDPKKFVDWYLATREHKKYEQDDACIVLRIEFEDLIFNYEETVKKIENFLGLDNKHHVAPKSRFNPDISSKNVGLWKNDKDEYNNIDYITRMIMK